MICRQFMFRFSVIVIMLFFAYDVYSQTNESDSKKNEPPAENSQSSVSAPETNDKKIINPETDAWIYAFGGYGYYQWKLISTGAISELVGVPGGMGYTHKAEPYIVKKYGVRANVWLFSAGLDYLGNRWDAFSRTSEDNLSKPEDKRARQLRYLSGLSFGNWRMLFDVTHRDFSSSITSKGFVNSVSGLTDPLYYYPRSGSPLILNPGDKMSLICNRTEYDLRFERRVGMFITTLGGKYSVFDAPTEVTFTPEGASEAHVFMYTRNKMYSLAFSGRTLHHIAGNFYFSSELPVSMCVKNKLSNSYYKNTADNFAEKYIGSGIFSTYSFAANFALQYLASYVRLDVGFNFNWNRTMYNLMNARTTKDITYTDSSSGGVQTIPAGTKTMVRGDRQELFWGFYADASAFF